MITKDLLKKAAETARINLSKVELERFSKEAEEILKIFSEIDKADTKNTEPAFQPLKIKNELRPDKNKKCLSQKDALANSIHKENEYFKGPKAI